MPCSGAARPSRSRLAARISRLRRTAAVVAGLDRGLLCFKFGPRAVFGRAAVAVEGFPGHAVGIVYPILVRLGIAAGRALLVRHLGLGPMQRRGHGFELGAAVDLQAAMT